VQSLAPLALALAIYGFKIALGSTPAFGVGLLEDEK
jgi:hypothetical protein